MREASTIGDKNYRNNADWRRRQTCPRCGSRTPLAKAAAVEQWRRNRAYRQADAQAANREVRDLKKKDRRWGDRRSVPRTIRKLMAMTATTVRDDNFLRGEPVSSLPRSSIICEAAVPITSSARPTASMRPPFGMRFTSAQRV